MVLGEGLAGCFHSLVEEDAKGRQRTLPLPVPQSGFQAVGQGRQPERSDRTSRPFEGVGGIGALQPWAAVPDERPQPRALGFEKGKQLALERAVPGRLTPEVIEVENLRIVQRAAHAILPPNGSEIVVSRRRRPGMVPRQGTRI